MEVVKLLAEGLIGSITFSMYWQYKSLKAIEEHNKIFYSKLKYIDGSGARVAR